MDARILFAAVPAGVRRIAAATFMAAVLLVSMGARQQSANFIVETPDPAFAQQLSQAAEKYRHDLAIAWLGQPMPNWSQPCVMTVQVGPHLGAGGATTFVFDRGEVFGWRMSIQGSAERLLDSVLPHEVTHMVFASHFRQPLPRWADEGGATSVEHTSERNKHRQMLNQFLRTGRGIAFNQMFAMTDYPPDIMPLYAQGYSLAEYLIEIGGRRTFVEFLGDGLHSENWSAAVEKHYGVQDLGVLQNTWLAWVAQGSPQMNRRQSAGGTEALASAERRPRPEPNLVYREREPQPEGKLALVPVHISVAGSGAPGNGTRSVSVTASDGTRSVPATVSAPPIAASVPLSPPKALPTSGWHTPGAAAGSVASSPPPPGASMYREQVSHPQPVEQPR